MKWKKRITEQDGVITISVAFSFSQQEALGAYDQSDEPKRTTLKYLEELETSETFLSFLRMYVFWIEAFNLIKPNKKRRKKK